MQITLTGWLVIFFLLSLFAKKREKALLDPRLMLLINYFNFWGKVDNMSISIEKDVMLAVSFLICYATLEIYRRKNYVKIEGFYTNLVSRYKYGFNIPLINLNAQIVVLGIFIAFAVIYTYIMSEIYGSFENAMIRFYVKGVVNENLYSQTYTILNILKWLMVFFLLILKLSNTIYKRSNFIFYLCFIVMLFVTLPGGSRGSVILLVAASLFADLYAWLVIKRSFFKSFFTFTNLSLVVIAIYCAFMLTSMRSTNYASISNAVDDAISFKMDSGLEKYGEDETDLMMRDYYYVVDKWGSRYEYLPFLYSVGTIVFNPIPRFLWQNKPVSFGRILSTSQAGGDIKSVKYMIDNVKTSAAVGVCGEGWANGGVLGVVFYSIIFGALSGIATKLAMTLFYKPGYISLAIAFFLWKVPSSWVRGDLTGLLQALSPLLLFTLILYVFSKKKLSYKS